MPKVNNQINSPINTPFSPAGRFRRLAAMVYDSFIVFSYLILITGIALILNQGQSLAPYQVPFLCYLLILTGLFLAWFWTKGQTLGMLAWKIRVIDREKNAPISFKRAFIRYAFSLLSWGCAGIGFLWCLWDPDHQMLHDKLAKTRVIKAN